MKLKGYFLTNGSETLVIKAANIASAGCYLSRFLGVFGLSLLLTTMVYGQQDPQKDLTTKSLDELVNIQVTSVSKKEEKLFQAAAAVYVITQEDIRRSGMSSIPELLRMV